MLETLYTYWNECTNVCASNCPALLFTRGGYPYNWCAHTNVAYYYSYEGDGALTNLAVDQLITNDYGGISNSLYLNINGCSNINTLVIDDGGGTNVATAIGASDYAIGVLLTNNWLVTTNGPE